MRSKGKKKAEKVRNQYIMMCSLCNKKFVGRMEFVHTEGWKTPQCPWCGLTVPVMWVETRLRHYA